MTESENAPPPPPPPAEPEPRRYPVLNVSAAVMAGLAAFILIVGVFIPDRSEEPQAIGPDTPTPSTPATPVEPSTEASDGGRLTIVEQGYTPMRDLNNDAMLSWGVIVENTSAEMVASAGLHVEPADPDGTSLTKKHDWDTNLGVPLLAPGQRIGLGSTSYVDDGEVDKVAFAITKTQWWPPGKTRTPIAELSTSDIKSAWRGKGERENYWSSDGISFPVNKRGHLFLSFRIDSAYDIILLDPGVSVIFRDTDGHIVGASRPGDFRDGDIPPGWSVRHIDVEYGPPTSADGGSIEIYPYQ